MHVLLPILRLSATLAVLGFFWAPSAAQPASAEAQVSVDEPAGSHAAPTAVEAVDATTAESAPRIDDRTRRARAHGGPLARGRGAPTAPRAQRPDPTTRQRSNAALYRVPRSGQAHRSAP